MDNSLSQWILEDPQAHFSGNELMAPPPPPPPAPQKQSRCKGRKTSQQQEQLLQQQQQESPPLKPDEYNLKGIIELLYLLGLTSSFLWDSTMFKISRDVSSLMNVQVTNLYFALKIVCNAISTGVAQDGDLSQDKLEMINERKISYAELMRYIEPILPIIKPSVFLKPTVKQLYDLVETVLKPVEIQHEKPESDVPENTHEAMLKLFGKGVESKKLKLKDIKISQQFCLRGEESLQKYVTPGEKGRLLIKIEVTDVDDLKGVVASQHWTKVWKKAIFLIDNENDATYKSIETILLTKLKDISNVQDVQFLEFDESQDNKPTPRKRSKFF